MYKVTVRTPEGRFVGFKEFNSYFRASEYYREKSEEGFTVCFILMRTNVNRLH